MPFFSGIHLEKETVALTKLSTQINSITLQENVKGQIRHTAILIRVVFQSFSSKHVADLTPFLNE